MEINNYLCIKDGIHAFKANNVCNLVIEDLNGYFDTVAVNSTGEKILRYITGQSTIKMIIEQFINDNNLSTGDSVWISDFIQDLINKGVLYVQNVPSYIENDLTILGDENCINPLQATIEVTDKCNLRCQHCYLEASCNKTNMLAWEEIEYLMDSLKENNILSIELTGGELFVHPEILKIIEKACDNFAQVAILTNGTILSSKLLKILEKNKDKILISVSIDSVNEEIHDNFRGVKGSYKKTCKNVKRMTDIGLKVRISSSIFDENMWEIDKLAELSRELGAIAFVYNFVEDFGRGKDFNSGHKNNALYDDKYMRYINDTMEKYKDIIPIIPSEYFLKISSNCGALTNSIFIGSNGDIRPCAMFPRSEIFGNILKDNLTDITSNDIYYQILNLKPPHIDNGCDKDCPNYSQCRGCYMKGINQNLFKTTYCNWVYQNSIDNIVRLIEENTNDR